MWTQGEPGPTCICGWPTVVVLEGDKASLMCIGHTPEAGALFPLPENRPDHWPDVTHEEMERLVEEGFRYHEGGDYNGLP